MNGIEIEYYDLENNYHGIGTFYQYHDKMIVRPDMRMLIPPTPEGHNNGLAGRHYIGLIDDETGKPVLVTVMKPPNETASDHHIYVKGSGGFLKPLCYFEQE